MFDALAEPVRWMLGGLFGLLLVASTVQWWLARSQPQRDFTELRQRIRSWWLMVGVFALAILLSPGLSVAFFGIVSFLALKEYFSIIPTRRADRRVLFWAYLAIPVQYYWVYSAWYGMFIIFIPVYLFLFLPFRMVLIGETRDFLRAAGTLHWGVMILVFSISHAAMLLRLPAAGTPAGGAGLLLFLVFLTQANDVAQYLWGKAFGRHRIAPRVSPNKTWEGFAGGLATTTVLAVLLGPWLTPMDRSVAALAGAMIAAAGFIGDVTISALKRDIGVKDAGSLLPGHGGVMDRIDSLTFTAPLFFHFVYYFYF